VPLESTYLRLICFYLTCPKMHYVKIVLIAYLISGHSFSYQ